MAKKGTLEITILGDEKPLKNSMKKATGILQDFAKAGPAIFAGMGLAAGVVFADQFGEAMDRDRIADRLAAQLGATPEQSARFGKLAGELYADAYGGSVQEVSDAIGAVVSTFGDEGDDAIRGLTATALDLAAAFEVDVSEAVSTIGVMLDTGLVDSAEDGFDLIVAAMQNVPAAMRGELLPILEEYSQNFSALGITGDEAFGLLVDAASSGRIELDKTGDALKELTIRATDMSSSSQEAFETLELDAEEMATAIASGGETAREAFDQIVTGLLAIDDPAEQANTAIALMGTPLEDLSVSEIPDFLDGLRDMGSEFGSAEGAAQQMGDTLNDNTAARFESFKRKAGNAIAVWAEEFVLPYAEDVIAAFDENGVGGAVDKAIELWEQAQPRVEQWFEGTFVPWWETTATPWMTYIGGALGTALVEGLVNALAELAFKEVELRLEMLLGFVNNWTGGLLGDIDLPDVDFPNVNFSNPVDRPTSSPTSRSGGGVDTIAMFHGGGVARVRSGREGLARLADKERVLSARQTAAFEQLVANVTSGGGTGTTVNVSVPGGDGEDIVRLLARWSRANGPVPIAVTG